MVSSEEATRRLLLKTGGADGVLRMLVTAAFSHRRKILSNGLKAFLTPEEIDKRAKAHGH